MGRMAITVRVLFLCLFLSQVSLSLAEEVTVTIKGVTTIAKTDDNFVCATLDWWPSNKCDYNQCPWGQAGILNLDLNNKILVNAVKEENRKKERQEAGPCLYPVMACLYSAMKHLYPGYKRFSTGPAFGPAFADVAPFATSGKRPIRPFIDNEITAFKSLRIRVGGSLQDQILYKVGSAKECPDFYKTSTGRFGFSSGCLTLDRWDELNNFLAQNGAVVTFGINALFDRKKLTDDGLYGGDWNSRNARDLIEYTRLKGYDIDSYEFGNELCGGGVSARLEAVQYAKDVVGLKNLINELFSNSTKKPKILAPGGFYDEKWFSTFLEATGPNVVDVLTHHIYNLGAGVDSTLINKVQDPHYLSQVAQTYKDVSGTIKSFGPWSSAWVGESGGAYNSGGKDVSHTFVNGFWYLDQLGMTSTFNHKAFCRQALIGGNYALLNTTTFIPNPDYYGALLWHRLMGKNVLSATQFGSPYLRAYSHCSRNKPGITLMLINMSNTTSFDVSVLNDINFYPDKLMPRQQKTQGQHREEYHLTPKDGNIQSDVLLLNGKPLVLTEAQDIPELNPILVNSSLPITVTPDSIVFVSLKDFNAPACA